MHRKLIVAILLTLLPGLAEAQTVIPIQNPSFETSVTFTGSSSDPSCGGPYEGTSVPGWATTVTQPGGGAGIIAWGCAPPPDGKQVAYLQEASISQDLGIPVAYGVYVMKFSVANNFYWYPGKWKAAILMGSTELCSQSGYAIGDFVEYILTCSVPYYISHYNGFGFPPGNLVISLSSVKYWTVLVDNVSLTFTPQQ